MQFSPSLGMSQKTGMNPQLYQSIKLMGMPIMDLREKIEEEVERNPALEVLQDHSTVSLDEATKAPREVNDYFESSSDSGFTGKSGGLAASDERQRFLEGALSHAETLQEHLLWQLRLQPIDANLRGACELLIQNLNEDGFHKEPLDILLADYDNKTVNNALGIVRALDPPGTCTIDYRESLFVQAELLANAPAGITQALSYLDLLQKGKTAEVAKKTGFSEAGIKIIFQAIKKLSPFPGRSFSSAQTRYVIPDIQVIKKDGEFIIILNDEEIPVLGINPFFMELADKKRDDRPARDFAMQNINEARWFINSINQRNHTLLRVSRAIVEFQRPFFTGGPKYLVPLTLKEIAHELALCEATISRTANGKYMQTEWGIFELRHFFSNSIRKTGSVYGTADAPRFSKEGVKEVIKQIIMSSERHLSDNDITLLLAEQGIVIARRTAAKYRKELKLDPSI